MRTLKLKSTTALVLGMSLTTPVFAQDATAPFPCVTGTGQTVADADALAQALVTSLTAPDAMATVEADATVQACSPEALTEATAAGGDELAAVLAIAPQDMLATLLPDAEVMPTPAGEAAAPADAATPADPVADQAATDVPAADASASDQAAADAAAADQAIADAAAADQAAADAAAADQAAADAAAADQAAVDAAAADQAAADAAAADQAAADAAAADQAAADAAAADQAAADQAAADAAAADQAAADAAAADQAAADAAAADQAAADAAAADQAAAEAAVADQATADAAPVEQAPADAAPADQPVADATAAAPAPADQPTAAPAADQAATDQAAADAAIAAQAEGGDAAAQSDVTVDTTVQTDTTTAQDQAPAATDGVTTIEADTTAETSTPPAAPELTAEEKAARVAEREAARQASAAAAAAASTDTAEMANDPEVVTEDVTEADVRAADQDFNTPVTADQGAETTTATNDANGDNGGLSNFEKALVLGLGALTVGAILNNGDEVVSNSGDRVVVQRDGELRVLKNDDVLLRQPGAQVATRTFDDGSTLTTVTREDGSVVTTIRAADGTVLRRTLTTTDGNQVALIDDLDSTAAPVEVSSLPPVPREVTTDQVALNDQAALQAALTANLLADTGRTYSLEQVREIRQVRALAPQVELAAITFETGSAAIQQSQADELASLGGAIRQIVANDPSAVFLVEGHTDAVGDAGYNLALSDRRAETVALALSQYFQVPPENLVTQGYGEQFLKIDTQTSERVNRRAAVRNITGLLQNS